MNDPSLFRRAAATVDDLVGAALHRAAATGYRVLVLDISAFADGLRFEERVHRLRAALLAARWEAEAAGVRIAIELPCDAFPLGPFGWRDLIDDLASPWVGLALDMSRLQNVAEQCDWIESLSGRLLLVRAVQNKPVQASLRHIGYAGLTF